jgi:probable phosphoglycerate mutase
MTATVLWMRHGTCADGLRQPDAHAWPDSPLTIAGAREVVSAARRLRDYQWRASLIVSSPLRRARHTAAIAVLILGVPLARTFAAFTEWRAPHCVLGRTAAEYPPAYQLWRQQRTHVPDGALPGGESLAAFADRARYAATVADDLAARQGPILIVSHRLLIGAIAALHYGHQHPADIFDFASGFRLAPAHTWTPHLGDADDQ